MTHSVSSRPLIGGGYQRERGLQIGRMTRTLNNPDIWKVSVDLYRLGVEETVTSLQWFPVGTVLVTYLYDWNRLVVDVRATILENGFDQSWLDDNEPRCWDTLPLF